MKAIRLKVKDGRFDGDAPPALKEGTELDVCIAEPDDEMAPEELEALNSDLETAVAQVAAGKVIPAEDFLASLPKL